jgi:hypothetical protein
MFRWFWRLLYESTPAEFQSAFGLEESVERLRAATKRSVFSALSETAAVGKVSETSVRLQRVIPMFGNSFKPFFLGRFQKSEGKVLLVGRFTMPLAVKAFMTFWLGMVALISIGMLIGSTKPSLGPAALAPFGMVGAGLAMVAFGKWLARMMLCGYRRSSRGRSSLPGRPPEARQCR